jgi:hypothetical protein
MNEYLIFRLFTNYVNFEYIILFIYLIDFVLVINFIYFLYISHIYQYYIKQILYQIIICYIITYR